jgi:hypothetical protein
VHSFAPRPCSPAPVRPRTESCGRREDDPGAAQRYGPSNFRGAAPEAEATHRGCSDPPPATDHRSLSPLHPDPDRRLRPGAGTAALTPGVSSPSRTRRSFWSSWSSRTMRIREGRRRSLKRPTPSTVLPADPPKGGWRCANERADAAASSPGTIARGAANPRTDTLTRPSPLNAQRTAGRAASRALG